MSNQVFITKAARFLPNNPISNEEMEDFLGLIKGQASKSRRIVLRNNGIKTRYYALTKGGKPTHTNAEMVSLAIRELLDNDATALESIELLSCGTSTPDQLMPSHGVMVHGWLPETGPIEVVSPSGVCCSGMHALKYAYMALSSGQCKKAVSTGSERTSRLLRSDLFEEEAEKLTKLEENPYIAFDKDFLRWMLSDGAGAFLLTDRQNDNGISLKIDWLEGVSYAHQIEPCMYQGSDKLEGGVLKSYMDYPSKDLLEESIFSIKQDVKLLSENIVSLGFDKLKTIFDARGHTIDEVDYFLPHMSSEFFRSKIAGKLEENGMGVPEEKWFTNLSTIGNIGAGSIYMMIEELMNNDKLKPGDKILIAVPESARFSYVFGLLTVC